MRGTGLTETQGLVVATIGLVVATVALTWATAVMARWMEREYSLKTTPRVVLFGKSVVRKEGSRLKVAQKLINIGDCAAALEEARVEIGVKRVDGPPLVP